MPAPNGRRNFGYIFVYINFLRFVDLPCAQLARLILRLFQGAKWHPSFSRFPLGAKINEKIFEKRSGSQ